MDQKIWFRKKKSSEKTIVANGKPDLPFKGNLEEVQLPNEKEVALEKSVKILNGKLTSLLSEYNVKEEQLEKHAKTAQEALAGQEKAEAELRHLRKDLDDALQEKFAANERTSSLNAALKDCMQQLSSMREEQEQRVHDAIMRTSKEFEKAQNKLEEKLSETSKKLANLTVENSHLSKVLIVKENLIEELTNRRSQVEAEFDALMSRLDSVEKENAFLRYELRMLEKDLDIRNEEIELSRRSEKKLLESLKKIKRLEAECQRLRVLVRKRMPGPFASANLKSEVEVQGRYNTETRRRKSSPRGEDLDISNKRISFLVERLQDVEQENKILRDALANKEKDTDYSTAQRTQVIAKLPHVGTETGELHEPQEPMALTFSNTITNELSSTSGFNEECDSSCSRSWASALISELENFKDGDSKPTPELHMIGTSDMSLMDDFVEMEKLAIVAIDVPNKCLTNMDSTGKELIPIGNDDLNNVNQELQTNDLSSPKQFDWLQSVLKVIVEQVHLSKRSIDEVLEDIKIAFQGDSQEDKLQPISGYITWKSPATSPRLSSPRKVSILCSSEEEKNAESVQSMSSSIGEIVELLGKFSCTEASTLSPNLLTADSDYKLHTFGWKLCELANVLQKFMHTCDLLLNGAIDFEKFAAEISSTLGWVLGKSIKNKDWSRATEVENNDLKTELALLKSPKKDIELSLQLTSDDNKALTSEIQQSRESIRNLQIELEDLRESKRMIEEQFENQKLINEDLDTQLTVAKVRLNEVSQKLSSLEVELEDKSHCCEELEGTCLELQLQLESVTDKEILKDDINQNEKLLQTGWEIKAASAKLAECEATILNLGNQLKALAKPNEASNTNKTLYNCRKSKKLNQRLSLLDRILSEDNAGKEVTHETNSTSAMHASNMKLENSGTHDKETKTALSSALIVVPSKKRGGGISFLRKLLVRRKKRSSQKTFLPFSP